MRQGDHKRVFLAWCLAALLSLLVTACAQPHANQLPTPPGGIFTSATYHFSVTYPVGWAASSNGCGSGGNTCDELRATATVGQGQFAVIPLQVTITRANQSSEAVPVVSSLAITVLDLRDVNVANAVHALATAPGVRATTLAGQAAYVTTPVQQVLRGANGTPRAASVTHTEYYLVHGGYEYQISLDSASGDAADAALQAMLKSFTLTA